MQLLLILGIIGATLLALNLFKGEKSLALKRIFGISVGLAAVLAIIFPNALTRIANMLGIGRGTDLLLYVFIVFGIFFAVMVMRAKARSDARVTQLARSVALLEARLQESIDDKEDK